MADKEGTERKVWMLPTELSDRLKAFQASEGIVSEVEAARRLLDSALQMRDAVPDILRKLSDKFTEEKDLRILARDVLIGHALVRSVNLGDGNVWFEFRDDELGKINRNGNTFTGYRDDHGELQWSAWPLPKDVPIRRQSPRPGPSWDAPKGGDLDDEIPF